MASTAILGARSTVRPLYPETNYFLFEADMIGFVMQKGTRFELWTGAGSEPYAGWEVGTTHAAHHDQSGREKGVFTVIGIVRWNGNTGEPPVELIAGDPDEPALGKKIYHGVFK